MAENRSSENTERSEPQAASIVTYTEEENQMEAFKNDMEAKKLQEKYCNCRSPVSLLVRRKTSQRARTQQNNEARSPSNC